MGGNLKTRRRFVISGRFQKKLSRVYPGFAGGNKILMSKQFSCGFFSSNSNPRFLT